LFTVFYEPDEHIEKNDDKPTDIANAIDHIKKCNAAATKRENRKRNIIGIGMGILVENTGKLKPVT
jgi:hypothetical protein